MKDTCVVKLEANGYVYFKTRADGNSAYLAGWPDSLVEEFQGDGVYSIRRVLNWTTKAVIVVIIGASGEEDIVAWFAPPSNYGICHRFLRELGVTPPPEGKRKTLHLVVTKRKK